MVSPRYLKFTVVDSNDLVKGDGLQAMVDADQVAGIIEVPNHLLGGKCKVELKWPADDTVDGEGGEQVVRRNAWYVVKESFEDVSALLAGYGVVLKKQ